MTRTEEETMFGTLALGLANQIRDHEEETGTALFLANLATRQRFHCLAETLTSVDVWLKLGEPAGRTVAEDLLRGSSAALIG